MNTQATKSSVFSLALASLLAFNTTNASAVSISVAKSLPYEFVSSVTRQVAPKLIKIPGVVGVGTAYCDQATRQNLGIRLYWSDKVSMDNFDEKTINIQLGNEVLAEITLCSEFSGEFVIQ